MLGSLEASLVMLFEPVFAAIFSAILIGESFSPTWILGASLILAGMIIAISKSAPKTVKNL